MSITSIATNTSARIAAGVLGITMALSLSFGMGSTPAQAALSESQIQSILSLLSSFGADSSTIGNVNSSLRGLPTTGGSTSTGGTVSSSACPFSWTRDLTVGATGSDVMKLQQFLNSMSDTMVASSGAGSVGNETQTFGPATRAAVAKFQTKYSISPTAGYVGPATRAKMNSLCASAPTTTTPGTTTPTTPAGTGLTVASTIQPANSLAVEKASRVPFTKFTLTAGNDGDVTVTSVVVQRTGVMNKSSFDGIVLLDENGLTVGNEKTLNSNDQAVIGETMVIPRGTTKTFTVAGNMDEDLGGEAGEVGGLSVVGVNTSATVSGALPITGATHTINATLAIGTITTEVSTFDPNGAQTKEIGTTGQRFAGVRITAGSAEDIRIKSIRFQQNGSATNADLGNVKITLDNGGSATEYTPVVSGDYYQVSFGSGLVVAKGFSADVYVKGDIVGTNAAARTVQFDIEEATDIYATGEKYGYGITPTAGSVAGSTTDNSEFYTNPFFSASKFTVSAGSVTSISKANEVPAQNVAVNVQSQPLGGFTTDIKGEPITVQTLTFKVNYSAGAASSNLLTDVSLVDQNGAVVAGPVDGVAVAGTEQSLTFSDSVTIPLGKMVYSLKGKLPSTLSNGVTVTASTTPSGWTNAKGDSTGDTITLPSSVVTMNAMTVKAAALAISVATTPSAQNIVAGTTGFTFAKYQLDATQSGEDVRFSSVPLQYTYTGTATHLTNCKLYDGSTALNTGSNVVNPDVASTGDETFTFDQSLTVAKGTVRVLDLKCDISASASGNFQWGIDSVASSMTTTGVTSNVSVTESISAEDGQTMSIGEGSLVVSLDSSSPSYKVVPANTTDVVVGAYKFRPANEDVNLRRIGLKLTNTASSSASDLVKVTLWVGSTQIGQATFTGSSSYATSTNVAGSGEMNYTLAKDTDTVVTVKADLAAIGTNQSGTAGHLIAIDVDTNGTNTQGVGSGSGTTINATGSASASGVRMFKSVPTMTYSTSGATLTGGVNDLLVLNVTADSKGEVQLNKLTFSIATTTASVTAPTFSGPTGNVASTTNVNLNPAGSTVTVFFDSLSNTQDKIISAGQTKTYTLRGTVTTGSGGNTVSVALKADTAYPSLSGFMGTVSGITSSNLIWSPSSTTTVTTSGNDWTNGYGLGGCFTSSGLGNDCTSRVLNVNI